MKRFPLPLATLLLFSCVAEKPSVDPEPQEPPFREATVLTLNEAKFTAVDAGSSKTFLLTTDGDYEVNVENGDWLAYEATDSTFTVRIVGPLSDNEDRKANIYLTSGQQEANILVTLKKAALLDISFNEDCSAADGSSMNNPVVSFVGGNAVTYRNEDFACQAAHFSHEAGGSALGGYYKVDYSSNVFTSRMTDGFSVEAVVTVDELPKSGQMCAIGGFADGGFSLCVKGSEEMNQYGFEGWFEGKKVLLSSGRKAPCGKYIHMVGVWDKDKAESRLYIDGELVKTASAKSFSFPAAKAAQWFCIGGNSSKTDQNSSWCGDIIKAKIYDAVLDSMEVARHFEALPKDAKPSTSGLASVRYIPQFATTPGSDFRISAEGLDDSYHFSLKGLSNGLSSNIRNSYEGNTAIVALNPSLSDGNYRIEVLKDGKTFPVGVVSLRFCDESSISRRPRTVAHRGVHNTGQPENSIAALRLAQEAGYYGSETDVWLTSNDSLMVNHDGKIGGYTIQNTPYATMRTVKLSNGEVLPSLYEYLLQQRKTTGTKLIIEIKDHSTEARTLKAAEETVAMVKRMKMEDKVEYIAFHYTACLRIRELDPDATIQYLNGDVDPQTLAQAKINGMDYSYSSIINSHPDWIDKGHQLGIFTNIWTVNDRSSIMNCISNCADYITTDNPETVEQIAAQLFGN